MDSKLYKDKKETTLSLIRKAEKDNPELGDYLKRHIFFDDKNLTLMYTGVVTVLEELMKNSNIGVD